MMGHRNLAGRVNLASASIGVNSLAKLPLFLNPFACHFSIFTRDPSRNARCSSRSRCKATLGDPNPKRGVGVRWGQPLPKITRGGPCQRKTAAQPVSDAALHAHTTLRSKVGQVAYVQVQC